MGVGAAIIGSSLIGGGLSYLSSRDQSKAAKKASRTQAQASVYATDVQREMYEQSRADLAPWRSAGGRSLADLERMQGMYEGAVMDPNQYIESPGYDWLQQQGISAINRGASARGKLGSGQTSKDLMAYGQGLALQDYQGYLGRLESLMNRYAGTAQVGQTASNTLAGLGSNMANQVGANALYSGQAQAGGIIGQANARTGLYQNLANIGTNATNQWMLNSYLQNPYGQAPPQQNSQLGYQYYGGGGQSAGFR